VIGNWNITSLTGKSTNGSKRLNDTPWVLLLSLRLSVVAHNATELDDGWKLSFFGVEPEKFAQARLRILVSPHLASCVDEWIPPGQWFPYRVVAPPGNARHHSSRCDKRPS